MDESFVSGTCRCRAGDKPPRPWVPCSAALVVAEQAGPGPHVSEPPCLACEVGWWVTGPEQGRLGGPSPRCWVLATQPCVGGGPGLSLWSPATLAQLKKLALAIKGNRWTGGAGPPVGLGGGHGSCGHVEGRPAGLCGHMTRTAQSPRGCGVGGVSEARIPGFKTHPHLVGRQLLGLLNLSGPWWPCR